MYPPSRSTSLPVAPSPRCSLLSDFRSPLRGHRGSAGRAALPAHLSRSRILPIIDGIRHLPSRDIDHELAELDGIAGARDAFDCHTPNMARETK